MKDTTDSPRVIGPGYRRDPQPKVVTPGCSSGDCGCHDCKTSTMAKLAPTIVGPTTIKSMAYIELTSPSVASRVLLREAGLDDDSSREPIASARRGSSAVCWNAKMVEALVEQAMARYRWVPSLRGWVYATTTAGQVTLRPGQPARPRFATMQENLTLSLRWILRGGLSAREIAPEEE